MESARALRPMGLLEIIDQTFRLYRANFWLFFGIVAAAALPIMVLLAVPVINIIVLILALPVGLVAYGALTKAVSDRYLSNRVQLGESYGFAARRFFPLLLTVWFTYLFVVSPMIVAMFIGFAIGGRGGASAVGVVITVIALVAEMVFGLWCAFVPQAFVVEDKRYGRAVLRSRFLIGSGTWAGVFVISCIMNILMLVIFYAILIPVMLFSGGFGAAGPGGDGLGVFSASASPVTVIALVLLGLVISVIVPMPLISFVLLYYDSRIRKEGFDLQILAREMGAQLPPPAMPPPATPAPPDEGSV